MSSTFGGLNTMVRGLYAHQIALNTVGNNITNINTDGYSRQRSNIVETAPEEIFGGLGALSMGTGCATESIIRLRDELIDAQVRKGTTPQGYGDVMKDTLAKIETIFKEPSDTGIQKAMDNFWDAWQQLGVDGADSGTRTVVRQRGVELVDAIQRSATWLEDLKTDTQNALTTKVRTMNQYITELASVNKQVIASPSDQVNALKDRQDLLMEKIARMAPIQAKREPNGSVLLSIGGITVVDQDRPHLLDANVTTTGKLKMAGTGLELTLGDQGGELQGLIDTRDSTTLGAPAFLDQLGKMSQFLLTDFNAVHRSGFGTNNETNVNFFGDNTFGEGVEQVGVTLQLTSSAAIASSVAVPVSATHSTTLVLTDTLVDGTEKSMTVNLAEGWTVPQVVEAINAQAAADSSSIRAAYDTKEQKLQIYATGNSQKVTAAVTSPAGSTYLTNDLKLEAPDTDYWVTQLQVNSSLFGAEGLAKIAAKSSIGEVGVDPNVSGTPRAVKSSNIWQGNTTGGAMTATVTGNYTFDPASLPIRVRIENYTTNSDGTRKPIALRYSTDGATWSDSIAPASDNSFSLTVKGATVKMNIAANAANAINDIYVVTLPSGNTGNAGGTNAVRLANLLKQTLSSTLGNTSLNGFYNNLIGSLGVQSQNAINNSTNQDSMVNQTKNMRDAISGVNLDEELTAMIKYQKGYNGCARLLTAMDELLDKLINGTGMVGR